MEGEEEKLREIQEVLVSVLCALGQQCHEDKYRPLIIAVEKLIVDGKELQLFQVKVRQEGSSGQPVT